MLSQLKNQYQGVCTLFLLTVMVKTGIPVNESRCMRGGGWAAQWVLFPLCTAHGSNPYCLFLFSPPPCFRQGVHLVSFLPSTMWHVYLIEMCSTPLYKIIHFKKHFKICLERGGNWLSEWHNDRPVRAAVQPSSEKVCVGGGILANQCCAVLSYAKNQKNRFSLNMIWIQKAVHVSELQ